MNEKKRVVCPCGNFEMQVSLTDSGKLEIECLECNLVIEVGRGSCPTRLTEYTLGRESV